ncbi:hypothetical protein BJ912DRAFT_925117 [Pholiota molesta]|nr:hypothetical protein BJ912DRAFT_925117 [Pholiota molesta]
MPPRKAPQPTITLSDVPDGFVLGTAPNHKQYLVPDFMLPALKHGFATRKHKDDLAIAGAQGGAQSKPFNVIAEGYILFPPTREHELLSAHAEILALQQQYGISYKDATHRLYMAQVERLKISNYESLRSKALIVLHYDVQGVGKGVLTAFWYAWSQIRFNHYSVNSRAKVTILG